MGSERQVVCPFVAFDDDRDHRSSVPDHRQRCFAESPAAARALAHQAAYCLSSAFPGCPTFIDWARREAAPPKDEPIRTDCARRQSAPRQADRSGDAARRSVRPRMPPRRYRRASDGPTGPRHRPGRRTRAPPRAPEVPVGRMAVAWRGPGPARDVAPDRRRRREPGPRRVVGLGAGQHRGSTRSGPRRRGPAGRAHPRTRTAARPAEPARAGVPCRSHVTARARRGTAPSRPSTRTWRAAHRGAIRRAARPWAPRRASRPRGPRRIAAGTVTARSIARRDRAIGPGPERPLADPSAPSWERPRRFEAYPSLKSSGSRVAALPRPVLYGLIVLIVGVGLFAAPFLLSGLTGGDGAAASSPTPSASASPADPPSASVTPKPSPSATVYTVKAGDLLSVIAAKYGVTVDQIVKVNPQIKDPDKLQIGDRLVIPPAVAPAITDGTITAPSPSSRLPACRRRSSSSGRSRSGIGATVALDGDRPRGRPGRARRPAGPERGRQDDRDQAPAGPGASDERDGPRPGGRPRRPGDPSPDRVSPGALPLPAVAACARGPGAPRRAGRAAGGGTFDGGASRRSRGSTSPHEPTTRSAGSRRGCSSDWGSRSRCSGARTWSSSTSRPPRSTPSAGRRSGRSSGPPMTAGRP